MLALSLWQPWASLLVRGVKTYETRSWFPPEHVRGQWVAVHAAARKIPRDELELLAERVRQAGGVLTAADLEAPAGATKAVVGFVRFSDFYEVLSVQVDLEFRRPPVASVREHGMGFTSRGSTRVTLGSLHELALGDWRPGRCAWLVERSISLERPVVCRGRQKLFRLPEVTFKVARDEVYSRNLGWIS